ncbi:MAG TPA: hypothetical protein VJA27_02980 [Patescibacteria group bacterium]|nr:hypothetical protein [Patescibacteria group bacterium]
MLTLRNKKLFSSPDPYLWWRLITFILVGVMIGSIIVSSYFIYQHIYRTIDDANTIIVLNSNQTIDTINMPTYNKALKAVELKTAVITISLPVRDIFSYGATSTPPAPSSTPHAATSTR